MTDDTGSGSGEGGSAADDALAVTARGLYGRDPAGFVAARTAAARAAESSDLAKRIGALAKPAVAAHLVDAFAGSDEHALDALTSVAARLREAESGGDPALLRTLSAERRRAVAEATERALEGLGAGSRVSASVRDAVAATFQAAVVDPAAAVAVRSALLVKPLAPGADVASALGVPIDLGGGDEPRRPEAPAEGADAGPAGRRERAAAKKARAAAERAEADAAEARRALADAEAELARVRQDRDGVRDRLDELRAEVADLESRESALGSAFASAQRARRAAAASEHAATARASELRRRAT